MALPSPKFKLPSVFRRRQPFFEIKPDTFLWPGLTRPGIGYQEFPPFFQGGHIRVKRLFLVCLESLRFKFRLRNVELWIAGHGMEGSFVSKSFLYNSTQSWNVHNIIFVLCHLLSEKPMSFGPFLVCLWTENKLGSMFCSR